MTFIKGYKEESYTYVIFDFNDINIENDQNDFFRTYSDFQIVPIDIYQSKRDRGQLLNGEVYSKVDDKLGWSKCREFGQECIAKHFYPRQVLSCRYLPSEFAFRCKLSLPSI